MSSVVETGEPAVKAYRDHRDDRENRLPGLRNDYAYDLTMARSIAVSTAAIEQALRNIYPAPSLLAELHPR